MYALKFFAFTYIFFCTGDPPCTIVCYPPRIQLSNGTCALPISDVCNGTVGKEPEEVIGQGFACVQCANYPLPPNGVYANPGFNCEWYCNASYFKSAATDTCAPCTDPSILCTRGKYLLQTCNTDLTSRSSDNICSPCNAFPPSQAHIAFYHNKKFADYSYSSMCSWGCSSGYFRRDEYSLVCERCPQPWQSFFLQGTSLDAPSTFSVQEQCRVQCNDGKYIGEYSAALAADLDLTSTVCGGSTVTCSNFTSCSHIEYTQPILQYTTYCNELGMPMCTPAYYTARSYLANMSYIPGAENQVLDRLVVETDGTIVLVARRSGIEAYSPMADFNTVQGFPIAGIMGNAGYADSPSAGVQARFGTIHALKIVQVAGRTPAERVGVLVADTSAGGLIRYIDFTGSGFPVSTLVKSTTTNMTYCGSVNNGTASVYKSMNALDYLPGTGHIAFSDAVCQAVYIVQMQFSGASQPFIITGSQRILLSPSAFFTGNNPSLNQDQDGYCSTSLKTSPVYGIAWDSSSRLWMVTQNSYTGIKLKLVTNPLDPIQCRVQHKVQSFDQSFSNFYISSLTLVYPNTLFFHYAKATWKYTHVQESQWSSQMSAGSLEMVAGRLDSSTGVKDGVQCEATMSAFVYSMSFTKKASEHAVYIADTGASTVWRLSMPCPTPETYWAKDGVCMEYTSGQFCRECSIIQPECGPDSCKSIMPCQATRDAQSQPCANKKGSSVYISPNTTGGLDCVYECNAGFYSPSCIPCNTSVCTEVGMYRSACGGVRDLAGGICNMSCTPIQGGGNYTWTSGSGVQDMCNFTCAPGFWKDIERRACSICSNTDLTCEAGQYKEPCTEGSNAVCKDCVQLVDQTFWKVNSTKDCDFDCGNGKFLLNTTSGGSITLECRNCVANLPTGYSVGEWTSTGNMNDARSCTYTLSTNSPAPTRAPTPQPTPSPTPSPTRQPTPSPTPLPTRAPTPSPSRQPTPAPTMSPTPPPSRNLENISVPMPQTSPFSSSAVGMHRCVGMLNLLLCSILSMYSL